MEEPMICVCVRVDGDEQNQKGKLSWYSVDLISASLDESARKRRRTGTGVSSSRRSCSLLSEISEDHLPHRGYKFVSLNSQIFIIGGCGRYSDPPTCTNAVYVTDTNTKESNGLSKFEEGITMNGRKGYPSLFSVDGKIYVFPAFIEEHRRGEGEGEGEVHPWAEVFDPSSGEWSNLPYPSNDVLSLPKNTLITHDFLYEKKKKIFVLYHTPVRLCCFDIETGEWAYNVHKEMTQFLFQSPFSSHGRHVTVEDFLYVFHRDDLYAYNLETQGPPVKVNGLQDVTRTVRARRYGAGNTMVYLFHLNDKKICMVWPDPNYFNSGLLMRFLKFRVKEEEDGTLINAIDIELYHCLIPEDADFIDCFTIRRALENTDSSHASTASTDEDIIQNVTNPTDIYQEEDSNDSPIVSPKEALQASTVLNNYLLQHEKNFPEAIHALQKIRDKIYLALL